MEASGSPSVTRGLPTPRQDDIAFRPNDDDQETYLTHNHDIGRSFKNSSTSKYEHNDPNTTLTTLADCERLRPEEGGHPRMATMSSTLISQTVTPFLREHIPSNYAPISKVDNDDHSHSQDPNSKFCYRHNPDSKCRKAADEGKMGMIQKVCLASQTIVHLVTLS